MSFTMRLHYKGWFQTKSTTCLPFLRGHSTTATRTWCVLYWAARLGEFFVWHVPCCLFDMCFNVSLVLRVGRVRRRSRRLLGFEGHLDVWPIGAAHALSQKDKDYTTWFNVEGLPMWHNGPWVEASRVEASRVEASWVTKWKVIVNLVTSKM